MDNKIASIISYFLFPIGWLIAYFVDKEKTNSLRKYHLNQTLGFNILSIVLYIILIVIDSIVRLPSIIILIIFVPLIICWVIGLIYAIKAEEKPMPFIGKYFENKFIK